MKERDDECMDSRITSKTSAQMESLCINFKMVFVIVQKWLIDQEDRQLDVRKYMIHFSTVIYFIQSICNCDIN